MRNYLFFRTDRIGDFLVSAILMKSIKRNDINSHLTVIASEKNYFYIKTLNFIDEVHLYPENFIKKISFFINISKSKYKAIFALDGKKRSIYFSIFLKSEQKYLMTTKNIYKKILRNFFDHIYLFGEIKNKLDEIKNLLLKLKMNYKREDINYLKDFKIDSKNIKIPSEYFIFHFDEKWIHNDYIKKYESIEPTNENLNLFVNKLIEKLDKNLVITTGIKNNDILNQYLKYFKKINDNVYEKEIYGKKIYIYKNINFFDLKLLIKYCNFIITCHGASTHLASAFNKKIFDIYDKSQKEFYLKWNNHIQNYTHFYRESFDELANKILSKL
jgi:ADP-heptose:LPS heptosyltransferase